MAQSTLQIRRRIKTSKNISQITRAMEMVSASKMRRAQTAALAGKPFSNELQEILYRLTQKIDSDLHPLLRTNPEAKTHAILLISTDKGLAGGLNTNLFNFTEKQIAKQTGNFEFITIGKKARNYASKAKLPLLASFMDLGDRPDSDTISPISKMLVQGYLEGTYATVSIIYSQFISTLVQKPTLIPLLPFSGVETVTSADDSKGMEYTFEPDPITVISWLLPYYIENRIFQLFLESIASEHSARMVAMKNAHDNASELVSDLTLVYNQARQAKVTNELLDAYAARMTVS